MAEAQYEFDPAARDEQNDQEQELEENIVAEDEEQPQLEVAQEDEHEDIVENQEIPVNDPIVHTTRSGRVINPPDRLNLMALEAKHNLPQPRGFL